MRMYLLKERPVSVLRVATVKEPLQIRDKDIGLHISYDTSIPNPTFIVHDKNPTSLTFNRALAAKDPLVHFRNLKLELPADAVEWDCPFPYPVSHGICAYAEVLGYLHEAYPFFWFIAHF
jgi:hypothetical protein